MKVNFGLRRIQVISGSAFVSLPRIWIKMCNLRKGDGVSLVLREDGIMELEALKEMNKLE